MASIPIHPQSDPRNHLTCRSERTRYPRKQLCVAQGTATLIRALKYPHTFEHVVLQQLDIILTSRFTKAVAPLPISPSVELTNKVKFLRWSKQA
eukprot:scaffold350234_cov55-Attheya_sp.AAC.1